jgi:hypothetical protein
MVFGLGRGEVGRIALGAKECVERYGDDVAVLDAVVRVVSPDAPLELEGVGDGVVDLPTTGMAATDDLQRVRMRRQRVVGQVGLRVESVSQFTQLTGVAGEIGHKLLQSGPLVD